MAVGKKKEKTVVFTLSPTESTQWTFILNENKRENYMVNLMSS